jgi:hypothetical protein
MRVASACLLSLVLCAAADAAPAPLPKVRDPLPSTQQVERYLRDHLSTDVESVQPRGKREWIAVITYENVYYRSPRRRGEITRHVYVVKYQGKDDQDRPQFAIVRKQIEHVRR